MTPFVLESAGVVSPTFHASALPITATCVYLAHVRDRLSAPEQRLRLQAWQLRQILPPH